MKYLAVIVFFFCNCALAQKISLRGTVRDSTGTTLPSATVMLLSSSDSVLVNFTTTDARGVFELRAAASTKCILKVTYVGFNTYEKTIGPFTPGTSVELGDLFLEPAARQLDEVTITAENPPVVVWKDTIEFDADSFKPAENATVEELLKKIPGIEVDNDGTIRAQGEQVRRMTVDGKNFFGSDPKIASKNLPADVVSKVQVHDRKSDQAVFSGIDDGIREKTINLELKEEKRKGAFGILTAGAGNDGRFQAKASVNKFSKTQQVSLLGMANNINQQGFGIEEYMNFTGGSHQIMGGGQVRVEINDENGSSIPLNFGNRPTGLMSSYAGGLNFNKDISSRTELSSNYFYNQLDHNIASDLQRVNFLPGGVKNSFTQKSRQQNSNENHRGYAMVDYRLDSSNSFRFTTTATYNSTTTELHSDSETADESTTLNTNAREVLQSGRNVTVNSNLLWRHRFEKKGRTFSINTQLIVGDNYRKGNLASLLTNEAGETSLLQSSQQDVANTTYATTVSYTEPVGRRKFLEGNISFRENRNTVDYDVFDIETGVRTPNEQLSNAYRSIYQYRKGGLNFRTVRRNYNLVAGLSVQHTSLKGVLQTQDLALAKDFTNILPSARFSYDFSNTRHVSLEVETSVQEPSIRQLQPVMDNSDPVNLYSGNPDLRPAYYSNARLNFRTMNPVSYINFFAFIEGRFTRNAITNSQSFLPGGVRFLQPVNVSDNKRMAADFNFGFPLSSKGGRFSLGGNVSTEQGVMVINASYTGVNQSVLTPRLRYDYSYNQVLNVGLSFRSARQAQKYEGRPADSQLFFNNTFSAEGSINFLRNYVFNVSLEYLKYIGKTAGFTQTIPFIDLSLSRYLIKGRNGELKFGVYNLLDRNIAFSQTASLNYYERQQFNNLGRYLMVSFTYNLNKQINPMAPPGGNRMIRIID